MDGDYPLGGVRGRRKATSGILKCTSGSSGQKVRRVISHWWVVE